MKIPLNKRALLLLVFAGVLFFAPNFAYAQFGFLSPINLVITIFNAIGAVLQFVFGNIFLLAGALTDLVLDLNINILNVPEGGVSIITIGWTITRDMANLGFVLLTIIMALATVIRYEEYGVRKLLPKLVAMAIIVNFSLAGAGLLVQFSNNLTSFFLNKATGNKDGVSASLAGVLNPQKFILGDQDPLPPDPADQGGGFSAIGTAFITSITKLIFGVVFTLIATIVMLMFAFMLFLRYLALIFLLILVPIVCLFYVFPGLKKYWDEWWTSFNKWVFFAPTVGFFIYISLIASQELIQKPKNLNASFSLGSIMNDGINMLVVGGLLIGSIIAAQKAGIAGAGAAMGAAKGIGTGVKSYAKNKAQRGAQKAAQSKTGSAAGKGLSSLGGKLAGGFKIKTDDKWYSKFGKRATNAVTGVTGLRGLAGGAKGAGDAITKTATGKEIKPQSLLGSTMSGMLKGTGWIKEKKPEERREKTKEELEKELDEEREKKKKAGDRETPEIDKKIRDIKIQINKKVRDEVELEIQEKPNEVNEKIKELDGTEVVAGNLDFGKNLKDFGDEVKEILEGKKDGGGKIVKDKDGKPEKPAVENISVLAKYKEQVDKKASNLEEKKKKKESYDKNLLKDLKKYSSDFDNKIKQQEVRLGTFLKGRQNIEKNKEQKAKALGVKSDDDKKKETRPI